MRPSLALSLAAAIIAPLSANDHWPQFRGPSSSGVQAKDQPLPVSWDQKKNVVWQIEVPGRGWSSPVVWGNKVFVTAVLNDKTPEPRKGLYIQDLYGKIPPGEHVWKLYCYDFAKGTVVWDKTVHQGAPSGPIHLKNTYASETPVTDGEHVYAYFGNLGLFCFDMKGNEKWSQKFEPVKTRLGWGTGASPVLHKDKLILVNDNDEKSFIACLDKATGKEVWKKERKEASNWSTPFVWENDLRTEIITPGTGKTRSYDLDGNLLWEFGVMSSVTIPTPFARDGLLYVSSGYILDRAKPVYAIKPGAKGDITLTPKENSNDYIVWCQRQAAAYHPSPVVYDGHLYVLLDKGFLSCYDAKTGAEVYAKQRIDPNSDKFTASPWAANGKIYCLSEDGDTYVVKAGPTFEVLAKNSLDEMTLATPALVRGSILIRTASKLVRIEEKK